MTSEIELAKKCGVRYFSTPEGTTEMWCYDRDLQAFADALIAQERKACAAVCARLRIATGERIGESDPATEAWNKALRDAERFIAERSNAALRGGEAVPLESTVRGENPGKD